MTTSTSRPAASTPFDPDRFLQGMHGQSFSMVGVFMLIRAHMLLSPDHCMTRAGIHAALRTRTPFAIDLVASVIDELFEEDSDGTIYCPAMDARAAA